MNNCCHKTENTKQVTLKFKRDKLLYDAKNYAFVEADVMGDPESEAVRHAQHQLADIAEKGNIDRVSRILSLVHSEVEEMLYPYTKSELVEEELDNTLEEPTEYVIVLNLPVSMSRTTVKYINKLVHEYMVYRVMADWLKITNKAAAEAWGSRAEDTKKEINSVKNHRRGGIVRKMNPF